MVKLAYIFISLLLLILDQLSKAWAFDVLQQAGSIPCIPYLINFTYLPNGNSGAAWGIFAGKQVFLIVFTIIIIIALIVYLYLEHNKMSNSMFLSLTLTIIGGIGNFIDRATRHYVIDFIQFDFLKSFPIFNIADICITVGVFLLLINVLFFDKSKEK